jgi:bifunctional non-homologous end joining protein LigD
MALETYRKKRDFKRTAEPKGKFSKGGRHRFVVHEHHASRLHYDFRLEMGGVLKSWAVPKGPSLNPRHRRLAVRVEDHPVDYIDFEGHIAEGNYGAGDVLIWDKGSYEPSTAEDPVQEIDKGRFSFRLHGDKLEGEFNLVRMGNQDKQWLLIKGKDEFADYDWETEPIPGERGQGREPRGTSGPQGRGGKVRKRGVAAVQKPSRRPRVAHSPRGSKSRGRSEESALHLTEADTLPAVPGSQPAPMPEVIEPMRATLVDEAFSHPEWLFESKWDGVRAICFIEDGKVSFFSRNEKEMSFRYPELAHIGHAINAQQAILDGEIVALNEEGLPSFQLLQSRVGLKNEQEIERLAKEHPVAYYVFDLLYYNGFNLMPAELVHRKTLLREIVEPNDRFRYSDHILGAGEEFFEQARKTSLEGIIAKHQGSPYVQARSSDWLKIKTVQRQEVVIAGYTEPRGARPLFGALVVGLYRNSELHYVGHVGGGFDHRNLEQVYGLMQSLKTDHTPFAVEPQTNEPVQWVRPSLVCEVKFSEWTADEHLRQPIFLGLRDDKDPAQCTFERMRHATLEVEKVEGKVSLRGKRKEDEAVPAATVFKARELSGDAKVSVEGHIVSLTHLDKVYWPDDGITKGDLLKYYFDAAQYLLPFLKDRPLILKRYPNGIKEKFFYQHDVDKVPDFVRTVPIESEEGRKLDYVIGHDLATLLYIANLGTISQNPWHSRANDLDHPDWVVFDLDPEEVEFDVVRQVALALRDILERLGLDSRVKTSGSRGLHVYVPIEPVYGYEQVANFAELVGTLAERENPEIVTLERSLKRRKGGRVYMDHLQNARGKSVVAPYSVRERPGATVSAPLDWDEVRRKLRPQDFTIENIRQRLAKKGDLFESVLGKKQRLNGAVQKLEKLLGRSKERAGRQRRGR